MTYEERYLLSYNEHPKKFRCSDCKRITKKSECILVERPIKGSGEIPSDWVKVPVHTDRSKCGDQAQ